MRNPAWMVEEARRVFEQEMGRLPSMEVRLVNRDREGAGESSSLTRFLTVAVRL